MLGKTHNKGLPAAPSQRSQGPCPTSRVLPSGPQATGLDKIMCGQEYSDKPDFLGWSLGSGTYWLPGLEQNT